MQSVQPHEHIIYDGGSTDGTLDILNNYASTHSNVILKIRKDKGQANAINLGFTHSTGDIIAWLNTDDWYVSSDVIYEAVKSFQMHPNVDLRYCRGDFVSETGETLREAFINTDSSDLKNRFISSVGILQPALFMRRSVYTDIGPLAEDMRFAFDYEYWVRAAFAGKKFLFEDKKICEATLHSKSITMSQRDQSILEAGLVVNKYYGFTSYQWIDRAADAVVNKVDGIIKRSYIESKEKALKREQLFMAANSHVHCLEKVFCNAHYPETQATIKFVKQVSNIDTSRTLVTAINSKFFEAGTTMIAGVHKKHANNLPIFIFDLGLSRWQRDFLRHLQNTFIVDFPRDEFNLSDEYLSPSSYGFKAFANWYIRHILDAGDCSLWIDAGIYPLKNLAEIFALIKSEGLFFVNHDDKSIWPFYNITFSSDGLIQGMSATNAELVAPHLRAGIMGYRIGGAYDHLIAEAFKYSLDPCILTGDKHPAPPIFLSRTVNDKSRRAVSDASFRDSLSLPQLRKLFGYFGHRHDQSIYSILAARYGAPHHSARKYCLADNASSAISKMNWTNGGIAGDLLKCNQIPEFYNNSGAATMQHRGTFVNFSGVLFSSVNPTQRALILGNGPSLKGFDFEQLKGLDVFGMNAAYRYWDEIKWYPAYYSCLDLVVGLSHKKQISRLIEKSDEYGIRLFLLRDNLIDQLGEIPNIHKVISFDQIRGGFPPLTAPTISTGSHTAAWAVALGYKEVFLLGIDCDYVEIVDGASHAQGNELEIVDEKANPNYFFDGYQRKGDRYNIPNPGRDIHLESWREVARHIALTPSVVLNANMLSKVDCFDFCTFEDVKSSRPIESISREKVLTSRTVKASSNGVRPLVLVAYERSDQAHLDETSVISDILLSVYNKKSGLMIDVGAHFGSSLAPFLDHGWLIFAFEPDNLNRTKLLERLAKHKNKHLVLLDTRCLSNKSQKGVPFFSSEQSSGISGLSAFHETHVEAQKVDITTLTEFFQEKPLPDVDFLKIDTEGHDLFVLQGFPWERGTPAVIECEFEDTKTVPLGYTFHDLARFLEDKGYIVYVSEWHPIIRYGIRHDWRELMRYPCELADPNGWGNLLAFRDPIDEQALIAAVKKVLKVGSGDTRQKPVEKSKMPASPKKALAISASGADLSFRFEPGRHFTSITPNQWRFTDDQSSQKLWIATMKTAGNLSRRTFAATLRIETDKAMTLNVSLGRYGASEYEGVTRRIALVPGVPQSLQLYKCFKLNHQALKLQLDVIESAHADSAELTIDQLGLGEALASIDERLDPNFLNLRTANRLFRDGDLITALGIYLRLSQQLSLSMYADNAVNSARKLGMSWVTSIGDLAWLLSFNS